MNDVNPFQPRLIPQVAASLRQAADSLEAGRINAMLASNAAELRSCIRWHIGSIMFKQGDGRWRIDPDAKPGAPQTIGQLFDSFKAGRELRSAVPDAIACAAALSPNDMVATSVRKSLSPDQRALVSSLMQAGDVLANVVEGQSVAGDAGRLRLIANAIAPQAGAGGKVRDMEGGGPSEITAALQAETPDTEVVAGVRRPVEKSAADAARIIGVSKHTAIKYCEQGLLEWRDVTPWGRKTYAIPLRSIHKLLASHGSTPPTRGDGAKRRRSTVAATKSSRHFKSPL